MPKVYLQIFGCVQLHLKKGLGGGGEEETVREREKKWICMCAHPPTKDQIHMKVQYTFINLVYLFGLPDLFITNIIYMEYFTEPILCMSAPAVVRLQTMCQVWVIALHLHSHPPLAVSVSQLCELYE
jgi:hypothetical protein